MPGTRSFGGVSDSTWNCLKLTSQSEHGTSYQPEGKNQGTSTTSTPLGDIVLEFNFDSSKETVTYMVTKKPFLVSDSQIWQGIQDTIDHCNR